ncbi:unnamed protein product [Rotaria sp. Silwood1]|nr:unnamed protein product [Rotaria sp. Silwood1]
MITSNVTTCIHQAFIEQAILHPNKVAITLDDQSLTYNQLLNQVRQLTFVLINDKGVHPGDIVCQYIDRSIEMIVGIMSIMMSGAVYAPLNSSDPLDRLELLVHQVDTKLILVNQMSLSRISSLNVPILDISEVIESYHILTDAQIEELSKVDVTPDSISHIVFTSGSTGTPKAVQIRHRNFMAYMETHVMQTNDIVLQLTSSSFDSHLDEINGALVRGAQLVALKNGGHFDFDYVTKTIYDKKVTYIGPVPSWLNALGKFLNENYHAQQRVKSVRCWYLGGETLLSSTIIQLLPFVDEQSRFFNLYGPAEITVVATCHEVRREELSTTVSLPIGYPLIGYCIYLLDEYRQPVVPGQLGEIIIGGVGVFAGYYGRADLTAQSLIDIDGEQCYATGDLARLDVASGELIFIGRRDYQVKLRGGTSLGAMCALNLIRQEVTDKMDISLLFTNPSVKALAAALEPILCVTESGNKKEEKDDDDFSFRPHSSWFIESLGIVLLAWQWLWPIFMAVRLEFDFLPMLLIPFIHLIQFPVFLKLFGGPFPRGRDTLYSWRYYRLWFLRRQWSLNTYWLGHLLGTPFYNTYLRLCGARIHDGGTQWLIVALRRFGAQIDDDVIIEDMISIDDVHLITIGSHVRLSSTSRIQVGSPLKHCNT